ncbi:MAG: ComEC/Rec2 family competence protein [Patescibacteria group bacterium]
MIDKPFLICIAGFAAGVIARSFFNFGFSFAIFFLIISTAIYLSGKITLTSTSGGGQAIVALFIFAASLGMLRFDLSELHKNDSILDSHLDRRTTVIGTVVDEPDERESSVRLTVKLDSLVDNGAPTSVSAKTLVVADLYPKFKYGDRLEIMGLLDKPKNFADEGGKIFDYQSYLAKEGIYYQITRPKVKLLSSEEGNFIVEALFNFKQAFLKNVSATIPEPDASLLGGLVVGAKQSLGQNLLDDFRKAGVIHIVVLSGYNITIVADAVIKFFGFLPGYLGQAFGALSIVLFAIMTGGSATVVRASIMALLVVLARTTGRRYNITRALLLAGFFMVLQNPKILVFDSSFQLSFMSTVALIYVSPIIEKYFLFVTEKWGLRSVVTATLATQIFVLPMLLYKMGELSIVALPVNLLILLVIPATMLFGFLAGFVGFISTVLAFPFAFVAYGLLEYELAVVEFFSHLPFAIIAVKSFPFWFAVLVYFFYFTIYLRLRPKITRQQI